MDPLTHTLVGASLAAKGLRRKTALATVTLIVAANLPDIDGVCQLMGTDAGLAGRRGITHGVVALVLLPMALAGLMFAVAQRLERHRGTRHVHEQEDAVDEAGPSQAGALQPAPLSFRWLLLLSAL